MAGYVPLFDSVLDGTLFGKWPHTGIWTCLLSQVDKHGDIDMNPNLLAAKIGVPVDLLLTCISDFMKPDPGSRTKDHDGRRLELIDPEARDWGWRVVNHAKYREKARLNAKANREVESGQNASRMQDRRGPPLTAADRLSSHLNSDTSHLNSDTTKRNEARAPVVVRPEDVPENVWRDFLAIRKAKRAPLTQTALDGISREAGKAGITLCKALETCCKRGWQGFEATWLDPTKTSSARAPPRDNFAGIDYGNGGKL